MYVLYACMYVCMYVIYVCIYVCRKNGKKKKERKTATDDVGMDDHRRIQRAEGKGTAKRGVTSLEVGTCRRAENLKKKKMITYYNGEDIRGTLYEEELQKTTQEICTVYSYCNY